MPRSLVLLSAMVVTVGVLLPSATAQAATCSDYSNQAAAQAAGDTRDADGDGIYCESLPCPCSSGGGGGSSHPSSPRPKRPAKARPRLGTPVLLAPRTQRTGCKVRGPLPDRQCTPGAYYPRATARQICVSGYTAKVRNVSAATKRTVYAAYGISRHYRGQYEIDHLVPLELGGSNSLANLFPEAARPSPGFREKDRVENRAHSSVCSHGRALRPTQRQIAKDWTGLASLFGV